MVMLYLSSLILNFEKFDKMRTEMYKDASSSPAGQDLTVHLGLAHHRF